MTKITLLQCKRFLVKSFPGTKAEQWLKIDKKENGNGQIFRQFSHEQLGIQTLLEENNTLTLDHTPIKQMMTWKENLEQHFSDPCYEGEIYTLTQMLDEYLIVVFNGVINGDCTVSFEFIDGQEYLVSDLDDDNDIPLSELAKLGYVKKFGQSAKDFLQTYWNF